MKRREVITVLGGAAAAPSLLWPLGARAQRSAMPVIGYLAGGSAIDQESRSVSPFRQGLRETGYIAGQNVAIEFRFAESRYDQLPAMAAELVSRQVAVITTMDIASTLAAKKATTTIPIVFSFGADPVKLGVVASLNRPGGNLTGVSFLSNLLNAKLFELLHEVVPRAASVGFLVNPTNPMVDSDTSSVQVAADALGPKLLVMKASTGGEIEAAFVTAVREGVEAFYVNADPFLSSQREQIVALAARHALPTIYAWREFAVAGGLMSYGTSLSDAVRLAGVYVGRILKGAKAADLPVQQAVKVELVINLKTAKTLGISFPLSLLGRADEVIE
jgi:putative tryptophan/tyrosine transport system substrate-binding protein